MERRIRGLPAAGNDPMAAVCQYVLAPALGEFTLWLLYHTLKSGKQRLYFLARDGYLMSRAALLFCETLQLPLVCRYLSCSRYSLRIPFFHLDQGAALDAICRGGIHVTLDQILARAGLTEQERRLVAGELSLPWKAGDVIPYAKLQEVRRRLQQCERFLDAMNCHSRDAMPGLAGYLQQEGLLEEVPDAIVDSGWVGSMQMALNEVLASMGRTKPLEGYYWGLYALPPGADRGAYHCYDFAPDHGLTPKIFFNNCLFEAIFTAPMDDDRIPPDGNNISRIILMRTGMRCPSAGTPDDALHRTAGRRDRNPPAAGGHCARQGNHPASAGKVYDHPLQSGGGMLWKSPLFGRRF
ncbi:MAG: hypothetical protein ACLS8R_07550 [Anaeromassilibacillus sp.]